MRINVGENFVYRVPIKDKTGTPVLVSACSGISAEIKQKGKILQTLTYPSANCRTYSGDTHTLEIEVVQSLAAQFTKGDVHLRLTIVAPDSDMVTDGTQKKTVERLIAVVD